MNFFKRIFSKKINTDVHRNEEFQEQERESEMLNEINKCLIEDNKPEILIQVRTPITDDKEINTQNAFLSAKIRDKDLQNKILQFYTWQSFGDLDNNLNCTMQLILTDVLDKYRPEIDGETALNNLFENLNEDDD